MTLTELIAELEERGLFRVVDYFNVHDLEYAPNSILSDAVDKAGQWMKGGGVNGKTWYHPELEQAILDLTGLDWNKVSVGDLRTCVQEYP